MDTLLPIVTDTLLPIVRVLRYYIITLYKQEKTINNCKTSFSRVSNAISKPSSKIVGSKIV